MPLGVAAAVLRAYPISLHEGGSAPVFASSAITLPAGLTPLRIERQGYLGRAYLRRPGKKATRVGEIDYWARGRSGSDSFEVATSSGVITVGVTVSDPVPTATVRYLDAAASPGGDGLAPASAWQDWATAVTSLPANSTLVVKAGVYDVPVAPSGPSPAVDDVVVMADPADVAAGNYPQIWTNGPLFAPYATTPNTLWELDPDTPGNGSNGCHVYRTVATNLPPAYATSGTYLSQSGLWQRLYYYKAGGLAQLRDTGTAKLFNPNHSRYVGPGMTLSGGRIYVRLDPPPTHAHWDQTPAWDWSTRYPPSLDPNTVPILFGQTTAGGNGASTHLISLVNRARWTFRNLHWIGGGYQTRAQSCTDVTFQGCRHIAMACPDIVATGGNVNYTMLAINATGTSGLVVDRCELIGAVVPWVSYTETKGFNGDYGTTQRAIPIGLGDAGLTNFGPTTLRHCFVQGWWLGPCAGSRADDLRIHHNVLMDIHLDAGHLIAPTSAPVYHVRNIWLNALHWSLTGATATGPGHVFEAFELLVSMLPIQDHPAIISNATSPWLARQDQILHGIVRGFGIKRYHCTWARSGGTGSDASGSGGLSVGCQISAATADLGSATYETYNNIYSIWPGWTPATHSYVGDDTMVGYYRTDAGYRHDGNHLHRDVAVAAGSGNDSLAVVWTGSAIGCATAGDINTNSSGRFEANGSTGDPGFAAVPAYPEPYDPATYQLAPTSVCRTGAIDVTQVVGATTWDVDVNGPPDYDGNTKVKLVPPAFRGCFDPDIPLLEQEIGPL